MAQGLWKTWKGSYNNVIDEDLLLKIYPPSVWRVYPPSFLSAGCVADWQASPRHHLVKLIRLANGGT